MSDLETLVVTFHTQLSDVMETVVKTAMYEVTRLVEVGLLQEMKRRSQEVESLRTKLQLAERKLIDQEEKDQGKKMKCASFATADVKLSSDDIEQGKGKGQRHICLGITAKCIQYNISVSFFSYSEGVRI